MDLPDSYFSGLFDGEGTVIITKPTPSEPRRYQLRVAVCMTHKGTIDLFVPRFGGNQKVVTAHKYNKNARDRHDWVAAGKTAAAFLETVRPWLVTKAQAADIALEFYQTFPFIQNSLTPEVLALREEYRLLLGEVNRRGLR